MAAGKKLGERRKRNKNFREKNPKTAEENMELIFLMCKGKDTKDQRKDRTPHAKEKE